MTLGKGDHRMVQKKAKKQQLTPKQRRTKTQDDYRQPLMVHLTDRAIRRLLILSEESSTDTILSDAVMQLWEQYYPTVSVQSSADAEDGASDGDKSLSSEEINVDKCKQARELHGQGMYIEDIAAELDWSTDAVKAVLLEVDQTMAKRPVADTSSLREQVKMLRDQGMSFTAIAQTFNQANIPTLTGSGKWYHTSIKRLLHF